MAPDDENQNTTQQEEVVPSLSTTSNVPVEPKQTAANSNQKRTKLHEIINETWGYNWLDNDAFDSIIKYADPDMAEKNKTGFELELLNGKKIKWNLPSQNDPNERISGPKRGFDQDTAAAMVAMARLRGWKTVNVQGTVAQKEMLWLAVQRQNLLEMETFERDQKSGKIPADGKFTPLSVGNFTPLADSPVYQQWLQEEAEWKDKHAPEPELAQNTEPATPEKPAPADEKKTGPENTTNKPEEKKTAQENTSDKPEEKKPEAKTKKPEPEEKKSAADSKFVPKNDGNSKFVGKGSNNQFSSKFNKVNSKPHNNKTHHKHRGHNKHTP